MFRKIVANLSFSPSLVGELGLYAQQLKREEFIRRLGVIFTILALIVQSVAMLQPPESANAASTHDLVYGGVANKEDLLAKYDRNEQNIKDIFNSLGITRANILSTTQGSFTPDESIYITGRTPTFSHQDGERVQQFSKATGGTGSVYLTPSPLFDVRNHTKKQEQTTYPALVGQSSGATWFAIINTSGNVAIKKIPENITATPCPLDQKSRKGDHLCQPCPSNPTVWVSDQACDSPILYTKTATNSTKNQPAGSVVAMPSDRIVYTISAKNIGQERVSVPFVDQLTDVLEYADVVDTAGGTLDLNAKTITWQNVSINPKQTVTRSFSVRVKAHLPATAQGLSNPASYDCVMTNTLTNTINVNVSCPEAKIVESIAADLPQIGNGTNLLAGSSLLLVVMYFYARSRQQREELRLIRKDINMGTL